MKNLVKLLTLILLLQACSDFDVEQFKAVYEENCSESQSVPLEDIKAGATCNGVPLLFALVRADDYRINSDLHKIVRYLINNRGFDLKQMGDKGLSLLQESIIHKRIKVAELIVNENTPFVSKNNSNNNVLHTALDELSPRNREIVLKIAQRFDGNLNEVNYDGESPLELAYNKEDGDIVFTLISRGVSEDFILEKILEGTIHSNVLFSVEIEKTLELVRLAGPALDKTYSWKDNRNEYGLIHFATEFGLEGLLQQLIESNANLTNTSSVGDPLELAAKVGNKSVIDKLLNHGAIRRGTEAVNYSMRGGNFSLAIHLMDNGVKPGSYANLVSLDLKTNRYATSLKRFLVNGPLIDRAYVISVPARRLIDEGRGAERISTTGNNVMFTFLHLPDYGAAKWNESNRDYVTSVARKIWSNWNLVGDEYLVNDLNQSLLSYALKSWKSSGPKVFYHSNVIYSSRLKPYWGKVDKFGMVPVQYAFVNKSSLPTTKELRKMVQAGAQINHINDMNESILHMLTRFGNYNLAKYLIKGTLLNGRPSFDTKRLINLRNLQGETPLKLAKRSGNGKLTSLLKNYGAEE